MMMDGKEVGKQISGACKEIPSGRMINTAGNLGMAFLAASIHDLADALRVENNDRKMSKAEMAGEVERTVTYCPECSEPMLVMAGYEYQGKCSLYCQDKFNGEPV